MFITRQELSGDTVHTHSAILPSRSVYVDLVISGESISWVQSLSHSSVAVTRLPCTSENTMYPLKPAPPRSVVEHGTDFIFAGSDHLAFWTKVREILAGSIQVHTASSVCKDSNLSVSYV